MIATGILKTKGQHANIQLTKHNTYTTYTTSAPVQMPIQLMHRPRPRPSETAPRPRTGLRDQAEGHVQTCGAKLAADLLQVQPSDIRMKQQMYCILIFMCASS